MFEELKEQYRQSLTTKLAQVRQLAQELNAGQPGASAAIRLLAHSLHGSGSTFGYPAISEAARRVELADDATLPAQLAQLIRVLLVNAAPSTEPGRRRILLVEDDHDISRLLKALVCQKDSEYDVMVAATAAQAETLLGEQAFELVVLDLVLPDGDGRVLLKRINAQYHMPVFVLSGIDRASVRAECLALGARHFCNKPFDPLALADSIDALLRKGELPGAPSAESGASPAEAGAISETAAASGRRVLVAEDDTLLASIIQHRLKREGIDVEHVESGSEALAKLQSNAYTLAILDVKMPMVDGFEVLQRVRAGKLNKRMPVIMLTAMGSEKDVVRGYELGASDYIVKPFSPVELVARVKSLLAST